MHAAGAVPGLLMQRQKQLGQEAVHLMGSCTAGAASPRPAVRGKQARAAAGGGGDQGSIFISQMAHP